MNKRAEPQRYSAIASTAEIFSILDIKSKYLIFADAKCAPWYCKSPRLGGLVGQAVFLACGADYEAVTAHCEFVSVIRTSAGAFQAYDFG